MNFYKKLLAFGLVCSPIFADDWSIAFPTNGWGECSKEKGNIDIPTILKLAKNDPVKVNKNLQIKQKCAQDSSNPNFKNALKMACQRSVSTPVDIQEVISLCNTIGVQLSPSTLTQSVLSNAVGNANLSQTNKLLSVAFPSPFPSTECAASRGALNFDAITSLAQMPAAQNELNSKVTAVTKCLNPSNPNFIAAVTQSCQKFQNSPSKAALIMHRQDIANICKNIGVPLDPTIPQNPYATPQQNNNAKIDAMFSKAFPSAGVTACTAVRGRLDFDTIADLTGLPVVQDFLTKKINTVKQCLTPSNPNFVTELKGSCQRLNASATKNRLSNRPDITGLCEYAGIPISFPSIEPTAMPQPVVAPAPEPVSAPDPAAAPAPELQQEKPHDAFLYYFKFSEQNAQNEINALGTIQFPDPNDAMLKDVIDENIKAAQNRLQYAQQILSAIQG